MKKSSLLFAIIMLVAILPFLQAESSITSVRFQVEYNIRNSVDNIGNQYIRAWSQHPSILTFVNNDGSVTVCTSNENEKITYVYEYSINLELRRTLTFENEFDLLGAFTKDDEGNYYLFFASRATSRNVENMAMVKYNRAGEKIQTYKLMAVPQRSFDGVRVPFDAGTCRLELSGSMLAVYFAREMFNGHQASYGFILDKDTFERIDTGAATNAERTGSISQMPYVSHSFNQFILPVNGGFVFADHGDAYPRSFTFAKFLRGQNTKRVHAFRFPGSIGANATYAGMGSLAKTSGGFIFSGTYGRERNNPRNLFVLTIDEEMDRCSDPVYLTRYTRNDGHAGHPKLVGLGEGRYLVLWELFNFSTQSANSITGTRTEYLSTFMVIIDEQGSLLSDIQELKDLRLNMNDVLRFNRHNGKVYWAINDSVSSITIYALEITGH
ncbi:MAG: hypothetical protein LBC80_08350 [Treponema sp.]|jgi:hypothetical protein|nr:hypothetical protein [Treponema sp.]